MGATPVTIPIFAVGAHQDEEVYGANLTKSILTAKTKIMTTMIFDNDSFALP